MPLVSCKLLATKILAAKEQRKQRSIQNQKEKPLLPLMSLWLPLPTKLNTVPTGEGQLVTESRSSIKTGQRRGDLGLRVSQFIIV